MKRILIILIGVIVQTVFGQGNRTEMIIKSVQDVLKTNPISISKFQLNQNVFVPSDTILFTAFTTDQAGRIPNNKILLYVQLKTDKFSVRELISVRDGFMFGGLAIPDSVEAGYYKLDIISNIDGEELLLSSTALKIVKQNDFKPGEKFWVSVEGGNLIQSVRNNLVVRSTIANTNIHLQDETGVNLSDVKIDDRGIGHLIFIPAINRKYFLSGNKAKVQLPEVLTDGIAVSYKSINQEGAIFKLTIHSQSRFKSEPFYALVVTNGQVGFTSELALRNSDSVELKIPTRFLSDKPSELLLLDNKGELLATEKFRPISEADANIEVIVGNQFTQRDSVAVKVKILGDNNIPVKAKLSALLVNGKLFNEKNNEAINANDDESILPWKKLLTSKQSLKYNSRISLRGQAVFLESGKPVPDSTVLFFYLQKNYMGYDAVTKDNGRFELVFLFDFFGQDKLYYQADRKGKSLQGVKIIWDEVMRGNSFEAIPITTSSIQHPYSMFKSNLKLIEASYTFFEKKTTSSVRLDNPNQEFEDEFMGADITVNTADYLLFPTMTDLVREIIPYLQHRMVRGEPIIRVLSSNQIYKITDDPLYVIDGHMIRDTKFFLSIKPEDVLIVKVEKDVNKISRLGTLGKNGIVYVQLKKEKVNKLTFPEDYVVTGLVPQNESNIILGKKTAPRRPQFKSTIYWNPSIKTDANGEATFYIRITDDVGKMRLRITGITDNGKSFEAEKEIEVNFRSK